MSSSARCHDLFLFQPRRLPKVYRSATTLIRRHYTPSHTQNDPSPLSASMSKVLPYSPFTAQLYPVNIPQTTSTAPVLSYRGISAVPRSERVRGATKSCPALPMLSSFAYFSWRFCVILSCGYFFFPFTTKTEDLGCSLYTHAAWGNPVARRPSATGREAITKC